MDCDEQIPEDIKESWKKWISELPIFVNIHLQRYRFLKTETADTTELHGFCDTSEEAYGAVAYLSSTYASGQMHLTLLLAKTKVARSEGNQYLD